MKIRLGFVSNSSDASFAIPLDKLTSWQVEAIRRHSALGKMLGIDYAEDEWSIVVAKDFIFGDTSMDNFDMDEFLKDIGVPSDVVHRDSGSGHWSGAAPPNWEKEKAHDMTALVRSSCHAGRKKNRKPSRMSDEEFFKEFLKNKDFESLEKLAEKSEAVKKILADPSFKVGEDESLR